MRLRRVLGGALVAGMLAACGSGPAVQALGEPLHRPIPAVPVAAPVADDPPPPVPPPPPGREQLEHDLRTLVEAAITESTAADWSVLVVDEYGRTVVDHRGDVPVMPASTLKVVTAAAALSTFGPEGRMATHVESTALIDADGVLRGDLVLVGTGDPALATDEYMRWIYPARPATSLSALADALVASGLQAVSGGVIGTAPGFTGPAHAEGWIERYFWDYDARSAAGLTVDAGLQTILVYGDADGLVDGDPGAAASAPMASPDGEEGSDEWNGDELPPPDDVRIEHAEDPARHAAAELTRLLEDRDVTVRYDPRSGVPDTPVVTRLASVASPPINELAQFALEFSDNHLTDGLFQSIGKARTGTGSWEHGELAVMAWLDERGIPREGARFADGSGLSRDDRISSRTLVDVDRHMHDSPLQAEWVAAMATMGETGTLRRRLVDSVAHGVFHGKTGSLRDVLSISGTVQVDDRRYHLAVIVNEAFGDDRWRARVVQDEVILRLAADLVGCGASWDDRDDPTEPETLGTDVVADHPLTIGPLQVAC